MLAGVPKAFSGSPIPALFLQVISDPVSGYEASTDPASLFTRYVNVCPRQKSRTIRASVDTGTAAGMPDLMDLVVNLKEEPPDLRDTQIRSRSIDLRELCGISPCSP